MNEPNPFNADNRYRVGVGGYVIIAWLVIILCGVAAVGSSSDHQFGPAVGFAGFAALGIFVFLSAGQYVFDQGGVTHQNAFGTFRILWRDIQNIEVGSGQLILFGNNSRFVISPPGYWSGPQKSDAFKFLTQKIEASGIVPHQTPAAAYKWHKNVRVTRPL